MAGDPWAQFKDAPAAPAPAADPWAQFQNAPQTATSATPSATAAPPASQSTGVIPEEALGFYQGLMHPIDRAALGLEALANKIPGVGSTINAVGSALGMPSAAQAAQAHQNYIAQKEAAGVQPGAIGEFAGNVAGTLPLAALGPVSGGAAAGALLSNSGTVGGTLEDMALGAAGGKVADLATSGAAALSKPLTRYALGKVQNWTAPLASATRDAGQYVSDLLGDRMPDVLRQSVANAGDKPILAAEALGQGGIKGLATFARRSGQTGDVLGGMLADRAAGASDRILGDYATAAGIDPAAARGDMDTLLANGRAQAGDLYSAALSQPGPIWNQALAALAKRPIIRKAALAAANDLRNGGIEPATVGLRLDSEGNPLLAGPAPSAPGGLAVVQPGSGGTFTAGPTAQAWDLIKKNVADQVARDPFGKIIPDSINRGNFHINVANKDLTSALRDAIPGYGDALDKAGDYLSVNNAFKSGQNFIMEPNVTAAQMANQVKKLSPAELQAFKGGVANKLFDMAQNSKLTGKIFDRPLIQQKLTTALGPENATDFLNNMKIEKTMQQAGNRMMPGTGSITSDVENTTNEQDEATANALMDAFYGGAHLASGNYKAAGGSLLSAMRRFSPARANRMSEATRDEAGRLLMMSPNDLATHLEGMGSIFNQARANQVAGAVRSARLPIRSAVVSALPSIGPPAAANGAQQ